VNESFHHENWYITMFPVENIRIIGVVKDYHFKSFRTRIEPLILAWNPEWHQYMNIKIAQGMIVPAMKKIMETLDEFAPGIPVDFSFVDESFDQMYRSDKRMSTILIYFTLLAVVIGVLGVIGMALFMSEQRTKEIAILKTYGASVASVITKLTREFIVLTVVANLLGWPLVVWLGTRWLNEFAYKTNINAGIFIAGAIISIVIAAITVFSVTFRKALANPADSLRYE
jgi:putative ABC transport system permease protein